MTQALSPQLNTMDALRDLHQRYQAAYAAAGLAPQTEYIDQWQAPCYDGEVRFGYVPWRAVQQQPMTDFSNLEAGLESTIQQDVQTFYGAFYAADLHLSYGSHVLTLSQVIADQDIERLQRNLIAHVLMKRQLQQEVTLFIGTCDDSEDLIVSVDNLSGHVGLEYAGRPQHERLADSLAEFLQQASPRVIDPTK